MEIEFKYKENRRSLRFISYKPRLAMANLSASCESVEVTCMKLRGRAPGREVDMSRRQEPQDDHQPLSRGYCLRMSA